LPAVGAADAAAKRAIWEEWEAATAQVRDQIEALLKSARAKQEKFNLEKYEPAITACYLKPSAERTPIEEQVARMVEQRLAWQYDEESTIGKLPSTERGKVRALQIQLAKLDVIKPAPIPKAMAVADVSRFAPVTHLLEGGSWKRPTVALEPGVPEFLGGDLAKNELSFSGQTTGRRSQLARWLTRPDHPLTARVIVNRLWQQHFGRGIVSTSSDFGLQGERPTHPELLDWLAAEFVESGWSLKHIHRLIVTSAAYQRTSLVDHDEAEAMGAVEADPANRLLWRANRRRLEGEAIRDAMLRVSGELNLQMHGPSVRPALPAGVSERNAWKANEDIAQQNRRSVYVLAKRNLRYPLFEAFDHPDLLQSCARRAVTVTATQSLTMLNSELTIDLAHRWAERLVESHAGSLRELIDSAYQAAFCREATAEETALAEAFMLDQSRLAEQVSRTGEPAADTTMSDAAISIEAVADFCHALFNSNEFMTVD
jgi:hypothetical protein